MVTCIKVSVCSVCFVCVGACVFTCHWAVWNGEGRHGFAQGGGGCTVKNEHRLPSDCVYILLQQAALQRQWGKVGEWEQRKSIHYLRSWEVKTSAVGYPSKALLTTECNNRAERELVDSPRCLSPRHSLWRLSGRGDDMGGSAGSVCLARACCFC